MSQSAEARNLDPIESAKLPVSEYVARTAEAVAAGHDAHLHRALESVSWERRGPLGVLSRRPRPQRIPGTAD
jgi:hypothetical protein